MTRRRAARLAVSILLLGPSGCGDGRSPESTSPPSQTPVPSATEGATPRPTPTPVAEDVAHFRGPIVVLNRHADGHPRQIGVSVDPGDETVWQIDGREPIYLWDGPLARELVEHVGREVEVQGTLHVGFDNQRTLFLQSYALDGRTTAAIPSTPVSLSETLEGTVVVVDRHADGHPRTLGIAGYDDRVVALEETNKSRELRYRLGRRVRVRGSREEAGFVVGRYEELDGSPRVEAGDGFRLSFLAGGHDENGTFMGGVEVDTMAAFDGKIFAGVSYRRNTEEDSVDPTPPGAPVLVLDRPDGHWKVDFVVPPSEAGPGPRIVFLKSVTFDTGGDGAPLATPVELLAAAVGGNGELYLRTASEPAQWVAAGLADVVRANLDREGARPDARSVIGHTDTVTGISHLFVGAYSSGRRGSGGGLYRATYDPSLPGLLSWAPEPEFPFTATRQRPWRVMGLTTAGGAAYASVGPLLIRREDGPTPTWTEVFRDELPTTTDSLREAVEIRGPDGEASVLFGIEGLNDRVVRVDPQSGYAATVEYDPLAELGPAVYGIAGYNGPEVRRLPEGGEAVLLGLELLRPRALGPGRPEPDLGRWYEWTDGLLLWRESADVYHVDRIVDRTLEVHPPVIGPRSILTHSPFASEPDVLYVGGFDHNGHLFHNTAWIFKAHVDDVRRNASTADGRELDNATAGATAPSGGTGRNPIASRGRHKRSRHRVSRRLRGPAHPRPFSSSKAVERRIKASTAPTISASSRPCSRISIPSAPAAIPAAIARYPDARPITSTMKAR